MTEQIERRRYYAPLTGPLMALGAVYARDVVLPTGATFVELRATEPASWAAATVDEHKALGVLYWVELEIRALRPAALHAWLIFEAEPKEVEGFPVRFRELKEKKGEQRS